MSETGLMSPQEVYETLSAKMPQDDIPEATFDDLLEQFEQEEVEFEYVVGEGERARKFRARKLTNLSEKIRLTEKAESLLKRCEGIRQTQENKVPAAFQTWKPFLRKEMSRKTATMIVFVTELLIAPKLTTLQCLRLADRGGDALLEVAGPILEAGIKGAAEGEAAALETEKNG